MCQPIEKRNKLLNGRKRAQENTHELNEAGKGTENAKVNVRLAVVLLMIGSANLTGAPIGGALIGMAKGDYLWAQLFAGASVLLGAFFLIAARVARVEWKDGRS